MKTIVTHNGIFHSDEVLAVSLWRIFREEEVKIIRTRNEQIISSADIAIDVGGEYDEFDHKFDHHQFDKKDTFYGLSSAGLIARFLMIGFDEYPQLSVLVDEVDKQDTGIERMPTNHFCNIISSFNEQDIYSLEQDKAFEEALGFTIKYVENLVRDDELLLTRDRTANNAKIEEIEGVKIIILNKQDLFIPVSHFVGKADIAIQWDKGQDCYTVQTVPTEEGKFGSKYKIEPRGTEEEIFCHRAGFIAKIKEKDGSISFNLRRPLMEENKENININIKI